MSHGITDLDYCPTCQGVFFDKGEFEFITRDMTINPKDLELGEELLWYILMGALHD